MIKTVFLASLIVMALIAITQQQANAQDAWTKLVKIYRNFTDSCIADGHTKAVCDEASKNIGK